MFLKKKKFFALKKLKKPPSKVAQKNSNPLLFPLLPAQPKWPKQKNSCSKMWPIDQLYIELGIRRQFYLLFDLLSKWIWMDEKILSFCRIILHSITLSPVLPRWTFLLIKFRVIKFSRNIISDQNVIGMLLCIFGWTYSASNLTKIPHCTVQIQFFNPQSTESPKMATVLTAIIVVLVHYEINRKHLKTYYTNSSVRALGSFENLGGGKQ